MLVVEVSIFGVFPSFRGIVFLCSLVAGGDFDRIDFDVEDDTATERGEDLRCSRKPPVRVMLIPLLVLEADSE